MKIRKVGLPKGGGTDQVLKKTSGADYDTEWGAGGSGITNAAAANELMKSDGTNAVASGLFSTATGNMDMGVDAGVNRTILAAGSGSAVNINIEAKGSAGVRLGKLSYANSVSAVSNQGFLVQYQQSSTNTVTAGLRANRQTSGTPGIGIGTAVNFETETLQGGNVIGNIIESVTTDVGNGTSSFDLVIKGMAAGGIAAERLRINNLKVESAVPVRLPNYTVAGVPSAASLSGAMIYVSNETGGAVVAFSDGTDWRRVTDRAIIS
jgi:hypothetical protein